MRLTAEDERVRGNYLNCVVKPLGNLHQRMKFVMSLLQEHKDAVPDVLWHAVHDLEIEVSYHKPAKPPFGRRLVNTAEHRS